MTNASHDARALLGQALIDCADLFGDRCLYTTVLAAIEAALAQVEAMKEAAGDGWLPIETAPRDGAMVILYHPRAEPPVSIGYWDDSAGADEDDGWVQFEMDGMVSSYEPESWQPLPQPPSGVRG